MNADGRMIKGQETKEKIILATLTMIAENGIKSLSAQKVAKLAGVSKSNIFHHFSSVDELPFEAMNYLTNLLLSISELDSDDTVYSMLMKIGTATLTGDEEETKIFRAFFNLYNESFYDERYKKLLNDVRNKHTDAMIQGIKHIEGDVFDDESLELISKLLTVTIDGFGYHYMADYHPETYMKMWTMQVEMVITQLDKYKKKY